MTAPDWRKLAACRTADPDLFFPVGTEGPAAVQAAEAKRVCGTCPVQAPCLTWAVGQRYSAGIWGGTTEEERRTVRRHLTRGVA